MSIEIHTLTLGVVSTNAYFVVDGETGETVLIDPVDDANQIAQTAAGHGWTIKLILATHAHFDHILASKALKAQTGAPFYLHADAAPMLKHLPQTAARFNLPPIEAAEPDRLLTSDREMIQVGKLAFETIFTPGHAPGHLSYFMPNERVVFCGDALFRNSIGRTDLPGSDHALLMESLFKRLLPLGDDVTAYPGHGPITTLGRERRENPFLHP